LHFVVCSVPGYEDAANSTCKVGAMQQLLRQSCYLEWKPAASADIAMFDYCITVIAAITAAQD
jgi:hypothetical protein